QLPHPVHLLPVRGADPRRRGPHLRTRGGGDPVLVPVQLPHQPPRRAVPVGSPPRRRARLDPGGLDRLRAARRRHHPDPDLPAGGYLRRPEGDLAQCPLTTPPAPPRRPAWRRPGGPCPGWPPSPASPSRTPSS